MRKWNLPLTYEPKIKPVLNGECTQTIRAGRKIQVGHLVSFHGWSGKPYRSPWSFGKPPRYWEVIFTHNIRIHGVGISFMVNPNRGIFKYWDDLDDLARQDFISPSTGEELGNVLLSMHKIPDEGLPAQIIRWRYE